MTKIYLENVEGKPDHRMLSSELDRGGDGVNVPIGFVWDGSSVPGFLRGIFPKWRHPVASCGHDFDCHNAKNKYERKLADKRFRRYVARTGKLESIIGYAGVRIGAFFGIGARY